MSNSKKSSYGDSAAANAEDEQLDNSGSATAADRVPTPVEFESAAQESLPKIQDSDVSRDQLSGRPRKIRGDFELPMVESRSSDAKSGDTIAPAVRAFLQANTDQTGLRADENSL